MPEENNEPIIPAETTDGNVSPLVPTDLPVETIADLPKDESTTVVGEPDLLPLSESGQANESGQIGVIDPIGSPPPVSSAEEPAPESKRNFAISLLVRAREKLQFRKRKKLDLLLAEIVKKGEITNDETEKLLRVSDKTAERYLGQLMKEGEIKSNGKKGKAVEYLVN